MNVQTVLEKVEKLPPAPAVLPMLLRLLSDTDSDPGEIVGYIKVDPSLMAQVLKLANSAYFGGSHVYDLDDAVGRIGYREVYKLVAMVCGREMLGDKLPDLCIEEGQLWEYSLATGYVMELLAGHIGTDISAAYTVGILHSLGKVVLSTYREFDYRRVMELVENRHLPLAQAERAIYGVTNAQVASTLLRKWKFDDAVTVPIEYQSNPMGANEEFRKMACMLNLSIWTVSSLGHNHGKDSWAFEVSESTVEAIGIDDVRLQKFIIEAHEKLEEIKDLLDQKQPV